MNENNVNVFSICPLSQKLSDEQVLALYHAGKLPYQLKDEDDEVEELLRVAVGLTLRCKAFINSGRTEDDVRTYYMKLFGSSMRNDAIHQMREKRLRKRFICMQVGALLDCGIFFAEVQALAKKLKFSTLSLETVERYIRKGKNGK